MRRGTLEYPKEKGLVEVISVAGTTYKRRGIENALHSRKSVKLVKEPDNPFDKNAIKVVISGEDVGYIPRGKQVSPDSRVSVCKMGLDPTPFLWLAVEA